MVSCIYTREIKILNVWRKSEHIINSQVVRAATKFYIVYCTDERGWDVWQRVTPTASAFTQPPNRQSYSAQHQVNICRTVHLLWRLCAGPHGSSDPHAEALCLWTCLGVLICGDSYITTSVQPGEYIIPVTTVALKTLRWNWISLACLAVHNMIQKNNNQEGCLELLFEW